MKRMRRRDRGGRELGRREGVYNALEDRDLRAQSKGGGRSEEASSTVLVVHARGFTSQTLRSCRLVDGGWE